MQKIFLFSFSLFFTGLLQAQQYPLFSNYLMNEYGFNPAFAGSRSFWDVKATYRTQWVGLDGAPETQLISFHGPVKPIGLGGYFFNDTAGRLKRTGGTGTFSYGIKLDSLGTSLCFGAGFTAQRFGVISEGTPDPLLMNGMASTVTDLTAGVLFKTKNGFYAGISAPQILGNKIDLTDENVGNRDLVPHYYMMAGHRFNLTSKIEFEPSVLMKYTDAAPLQYDLSARAIFNNKFWVGGTYREGAAASGMMGFAVTPIIELAYAYDVTFNEVKEASTGSHEITLGLKLGVPKDSDGDGIPDKEDECPDEPGVPELKGCPEPVAEENNDKDGDGVLDPFDECPYEKGPAKNHGCPEEGDRDKDGLADSVDECPDEWGLPIHKGCPIQDSDGDLVADEFDKCPKTPGVAANDGCPMVTNAERAILDLAIQNLYFDTNKSIIKPESFRFLDKLAELLKVQTHYKVKIEGHADSRGTDEFNLQLSKERAFAVQAYLGERGVPSDQLVLEYYGESKPMASNAVEDTRRFNRRVEMSFIWD